MNSILNFKLKDFMLFFYRVFLLFNNIRSFTQKCYCLVFKRQVHFHSLFYKSKNLAPSIYFRKDIFQVWEYFIAFLDKREIFGFGHFLRLKDNTFQKPKYTVIQIIFFMHFPVLKFLVVKSSNLKSIQNQINALFSYTTKLNLVYTTFFTTYLFDKNHLKHKN